MSVMEEQDEQKSFYLIVDFLIFIYILSLTLKLLVSLSSKVPIKSVTLPKNPIFPPWRKGLLLSEIEWSGLELD